MLIIIIYRTSSNLTDKMCQPKIIARFKKRARIRKMYLDYKLANTLSILATFCGENPNNSIASLLSFRLCAGGLCHLHARRPLTFAQMRAENHDKNQYLIKRLINLEGLRLYILIESDIDICKKLKTGSYLDIALLKLSQPVTLTLVIDRSQNC